MANNPSTAAGAPRRSLWPTAIIGVFIVFLAGCITFVVYATRHQVDLVSSDYYAQELKHQEQMDRVARTQGIQSQVRIAYDAALQAVTLALPIEHARQKPAGEIHFYRPSASGLDRRERLAVDAQGIQKLDARALAPGLWRVRVTWSVSDQQYFWDEKVEIPKIN
jgi:hypothetical protein